MNGILNRDIDRYYQRYQLERDFTYITPVYFDEWDEIAQAIIQTSSEEKWIIYVSSETDGEILLQKIIQIGCTDAVFVTAKKRKNRKFLEHKVFRQIVKEARFDQRVLITTRVLDNGINLKDQMLKHMVIGAFDKTSFLQIIGRKRKINQDDKLKLYIKNESEGVVQNNFKNHILQILLFWASLQHMCHYGITSSYKYSRKLKEFNSRYVEDGKYKYPFHKYVIADNTAKSSSQSKPALICIYKPITYLKNKLTYDYYQMMAIFEQAENERLLEASERGIDTEEYYFAVEKELQAQQFMWLRTQLSWLELDEEAFNPSESKNWITSHTGQTQRSSQELLSFLNTHSSGVFLTEEEETVLKNLFCNWIQNIHPRHKDRKSKGSVSVINRCFMDLNIPYQITSRRKTINGKQRNWWLILKSDTFS